MTALRRLLEMRRRARYVVRWDTAHVTIDSGVELSLKPRDDAQCFAKTELFQVITSNDGPLDAEQRKALARFVKALHAVEASRPPRVSDALFAAAVLAAWRIRWASIDRAASLIDQLVDLDRPLSQRDLQFYLAFDRGLPLAAMARSLRDEKTAVFVRERAKLAVSGGDHVLVLGVPRSGTRWLYPIARAVIREGTSDSFVLIDALTMAPESTRSHEEKPNRFFETARDNNLYLDPETEGDLLAAYLDDPMRALDLLVPEGDRMIAKASTTHAPDALLDALSARLPKLKVITITRDPRNVFLSQRHFDAGGGDGAMIERLREIVGQASLCESRVLASGGLALRYEELLADTRSGVLAVARHLGVALSEAALGRVVAQVSFEAMSGGRTYGVRRDGHHFRGGSRWEEELSGAQKELVATQLAGLLAMIGY